MASRSRIGGLAASVVALAVCSAPAGAEPASYSIEITGFVPVICNVSMPASIVAVSEGVVDLGQISEFCNSPLGYQVWVDHTPGVHSASFHVDGQAVPLSPTGSTMISSSASAASQSRHLSLDLGEDNETLNYFSVRIAPL